MPDHTLFVHPDDARTETWPTIPPPPPAPPRRRVTAAGVAAGIGIGIELLIAAGVLRVVMMIWHW
jgi:hypothetical protein